MFFYKKLNIMQYLHKNKLLIYESNVFDLPVLIPSNRKAYTTFLKFLIKGGFIMPQNSVYGKPALNAMVADSIMKGLRQCDFKIALFTAHFSL